MKFEIKSIVTERSIDGERTIEAIAQDQEKTKVEIIISNMLKSTPEIVAKVLNKRYQEILLEKKLAPKIKIGDIVG